MDPEDGAAIIAKAIEKDHEERAFRMWTVQLPYMSKDDFVPFKEYLDRLTGKNIDRRPTLEILAELEEVEKRLKGGAADGS